MMTDPANALPQIPGLDMVGRGVYVRRRYPFALKDVQFRRADHQVCPSKETEASDLVSAGYEVDAC